MYSIRTPIHIAKLSFIASFEDKLWSCHVWRCCCGETDLVLFLQCLLSSFINSSWNFYISAENWIVSFFSYCDLCFKSTKQKQQMCLLGNCSKSPACGHLIEFVWLLLWATLWPVHHMLAAISWKCTNDEGNISTLPFINVVFAKKQQQLVLLFLWGWIELFTNIHLLYYAFCIEGTGSLKKNQLSY